jgi:hypothetical protein
MSYVETALSQRVRLAAQSLNDQGIHQGLSLAIRGVTARIMHGWGAATTRNGDGGALGLESLGSVEPIRNTEFNSATDGSPEELLSELDKLGMPERHRKQVTETCMLVLDGSYDASSIMRGGYVATGQHVASLSDVVGRTSAAGVGAAENDIGTEAFGEDINRLNTDDRLTMSLAIMRPWENIMDKAFARVNDSSPIVTIKVPKPEVYDWSLTQKNGSTAWERSKSTPLRDLYRNPSRVNTAAKRIIALNANDDKQVLFAGSTDANFYKTGKQISTMDLSRDTNKFGYHQVDRTDLVADGALLDKVLVTITDPSGNGGAGVKETFVLNSRALSLAMFVTQAANTTSGDRIVNLPCNLPISADTKQYNDAPSTIAAKLTDARVLVKLMVNANLNLQTGIAHASGSANKEILPIAGGTISNATNTYFGQLLVEFSAFSIESYFNEENQRKANLAVLCQYREMQFVVPRSRVYFTEYALAQDLDENAISATSSVIALGNGRRGLDTVVNRLNDVAATLDFIAKYPEVAEFNNVDETSFVSSLVKPSVITATMDFGTEELNVMNESTRLSEIHGRFRARLLSVVTQLMANSLMLNQYKGGETPVFKLFVHSTIADIVIGILDYHPDLDDRETVATGADYSMKLPNGYRIDVIKSNMDCLKQRLYGVPVIESDMSNLLSAASIRDCGTVTLNYSPTNAGAVVRRVATTTREIVMMSNPVGFMFEIKGLATQLGVAKYEALKLGADDNDKLGV